MVEQRLLDGIREQFELFGFAPIETRSVEPLDQLLAKGETDKEIYTLRRLQAEGDEPAEFGLHFDLTVPLARYVAQHLNDLRFPFKRYQIQKAWRGGGAPGGRPPGVTQADTLGVEDVTPAMRALDKLGKRGPEKVREELAGLGAPADELLALAEVRGDVAAGVRAL